MRKVSLKFKLTVLYTVLMTSVVCGILTLLFSLNSQELLYSVRNQLEETVAEARNDITYSNGKLKFDSDLLELEHGIFLSIYASDGTLLYGKIPYEFENSVPFDDGNIRRYQGTDETMFYVLDLIYQIPEYGVVDIRGITSITEAEASLKMMIHLAAVLLPLLVILMAVLGYFMTRRTLQPVAYITGTAKAIWEDGDFSRRIALGNGRDEIYTLADTFDQLLERVENSLKREQQFTSDVSHELRTPVSTMQLQCEELLHSNRVDKETKEQIGVLYEKIRYLSQMISQLLLLSRADQGKAQLMMEEINSGELAELAVEEIKANAEEKGIHIHLDIDPGIRMYADETLLIRFWMNLLKNAVTYGRENGTIHVKLQKYENEIQGEVSDDGIGIAAEDLPHIWERFYQADRSRTGGENAGLGLSMVKWIVEVHHGTIAVESTPGIGTRFYFSFPIGL